MRTLLLIVLAICLVYVLDASSTWMRDIVEARLNTIDCATTEHQTSGD